MKRESRLSGVATLRRPDKLELLFTDEDNKLPFDPLETEGDPADGEEIFGTAFLVVLLAVLPNGEEGTLLEEETDGDDVAKDFFPESCLFASEEDSVLEVRAIGAEDTDFLVSEIADRVNDLVATEGNELLLPSRRDCLGDSEAGGLIFLLATGLTLVCLLVIELGCFSGKPPVLFLLTTGTNFEELAFVAVDLMRVLLKSELLFTSIVFLVGPVGPKTFCITVAFGFTVFDVLFTLPADECSCNSEFWGPSGGSSPD